MTAPLHRIRNYEELDGAQGREVFFRPQRYSAADLAPLRATVSLRAGGEHHQCPLLDVSQNGVAFESPSGLRLAVGDRLAEIGVAFDEHQPYRGEGRVGSVREVQEVTVVGVSFEGPLLPIDEVLNLRSIRSFAPDGVLPAGAWRTQGNDQFKVLVAELRLYLQDTEQQLARLEKELPWHLLHGEQSPERTALIKKMGQSVAAEIGRATEEIDGAVRSAPPSQVPALVNWSRKHLHEFMMLAPSMARAFQKPFGYPGDYEVMRFIYEKPFEGPTLFAKTLSLSFDQSKAGRAVRYRKDLVKRQLMGLVEAHRPLRILAVACGPAQEIVEFLQETTDLPPIELVLFDQDKGALACSYRRLTPLVEARHQGRVKIVYLHESIKRLLRDSELFATFGSFDLIYSVGLFDYLRPTTAVVLARNLEARLVQGGRLLIANMVPDMPSRWFMEHHLDWWLLLRSRTELLDLARRAAPHARIQILEEESGVNPFVELARE